MKHLVFATLIVIIAGCSRPKKIGEVTGWKPVYAGEAEFKTISSSVPEDIVNGGKIAYATGKIYMVEQGKGVHIVNYSNPLLPVKERFIKVPGCYEVTYKNGYLIVNNGPDLVSLDISQPQSAVVTSRVAGVFKSIQEANSVPPDAANGDYFECPDFSKGNILYWEKLTLNNPKCRVQAVR